MKIPSKSQRRTMVVVLALLSLPAVRVTGADRPIDWKAVGAETGRLLSEYARIDTTSPPGRTIEAVAFLEGHLRAAGLEVERTGANEEKPILIARLRGRGGRGRPIVLLNHTDVVPAEAGRWSFPPFSGAIRDGEVRGRGTIDMKGFAVVQLMALRLLAERTERVTHDVLFVAVPDEEVGGAEGMGWLERNRPDVLAAAAVWGEGGIGLGDAFKVPALLIAVAEKQVLWLRLVAEGRSGHGSRPFADAAPRRLTAAIERLFAEPPPPRLTPTVREMFRRLGTAQGGIEGFAMRRLKNPVVWLFSDGLLQQNPAASALARDTIALTRLDAGYKPNVIPERAEAVLDCRLLPDTDQERFLENLSRVVDDPKIRIEIIQPAEPAPASPVDHPLFLAMAEAAGRAYPEATTTPYLSAVGTDLRFFRRRGVPSYGFMPFLLSTELYSTVHGVDERLPVDRLAPAVRVVYETLGQM